MEETHTTDKRPQKRKISVERRTLLYFVVGLLVGALLLGAFRFINLKDTSPHYHANFALYVNGVRDEFKMPTYYEDVQSCGGDETSPRTRVHLHNLDAASVHVHDNAATWGALFANLGYVLGDGVIRTSTGIYVDGQDDKKLTFILNDEQVVDVANRIIQSEDVLLISYGNEDDATLTKHYAAIPRTAAEKNVSKDPAACAGAHEIKWQDRLRAALGLNKPSHDHASHTH